MRWPGMGWCGRPRETMARERDECLRCKLPVPQGDGIMVPTRGGAKRPCHLDCATDLRGAVVMGLTRRDRERLLAHGIRRAIPHGRRLGLAPRTFGRA